MNFISVCSRISLSVSDDQCPLQSIGLGGNDIQDDGAVHLASALKSNTQLKSLGLGGNQICELSSNSLPCSPLYHFFFFSPSLLPLLFSPSPPLSILLFSPLLSSSSSSSPSLFFLRLPLSFPLNLCIYICVHMYSSVCVGVCRCVCLYAVVFSHTQSQYLVHVRIKCVHKWYFPFSHFCCVPLSQPADEGGRAFGEMLKYNYTLRKLLLSSNILGQLIHYVTVVIASMYVRMYVYYTVCNNMCLYVQYNHM